MHAVPAVRDATTQVAKSIGAADSGVGGEAPALYDISSISNSDLVRVIPIAILAIGILLALGILMDTFLVRTLLVPSTVVLLGRWNWWPSRMSRKGAEPAALGAEPADEPATA